MKKSTKLSPEVLERAVRTVFYARYTEARPRLALSVGGQLGRQLRQCVGRDDQWPVQGRSHSPARPLEECSCRGAATLKWVYWFNNHRLLEPLAYIPLAEADSQDVRSLTPTRRSPASAGLENPDPPGTAAQK